MTVPRLHIIVNFLFGTFGASKESQSRQNQRSVTQNPLFEEARITSSSVSPPNSENICLPFRRRERPTCLFRVRQRVLDMLALSFGEFDAAQRLFLGRNDCGRSVQFERKHQRGIHGDLCTMKDTKIVCDDPNSRASMCWTSNK